MYSYNSADYNYRKLIKLKPTVPFTIRFTLLFLLQLRHIIHLFCSQDNYNALHIASMFSREDVVKVLLNKKGVDIYAPGGVSGEVVGE